MAVSLVRERILTEFDSLSAKQRRLARYLLDNETAPAFRSASDIAAEAGTSSATVVRFARALGYDGYTDMQDAVRATFRPYRTVAEKMADRLADRPDGQDLPDKVVKAAVRAVRGTIAWAGHKDMAKIVESILAAEQIKIIGSGLSSPAALLAEYHLVTLGLPARTFINEGAGQLLHLAHISPADLVIVISIWRYIRSTIEAAQLARQVGATCIAITDSPVARVAGLADHVLVANTEGPAHSRTLSGIIALIDFIAAAIADRRPEASMAAIKRIEDLYYKNNMLLEE